MPSPYDVIVVGSGPAGGTAARYAARRGLKVLLVDKRKEIGVPVQCGEYVAHNEEVRSMFPDVEELEDLMAVPYQVREDDTPVIRIWSPKGGRYEVPFKGFTVRRVRTFAGSGAGQGDRWVRAGDGPSASNGEGQCDARRGCGGHGHGDERRREQRGDDRGSDRGPDSRGPSPRWHAARRIRDAVARRRRRALGPGCADQEARGPILRERPAPGGGDGPHRA